MIYPCSGCTGGNQPAFQKKQQLQRDWSLLASVGERKENATSNSEALS